VVAGLRARLGVVRGSFRLDLELDVEPGEVVGLLGPTGSGKSTALRTLAGLIALQSGRIELADRVLADAGDGLHRPPYDRRIGVVFQDYLLFPHLSVLENVAFGLRSRGVPAAQARTQARDQLERLAVAELAAARPSALSGGQAQRVALARALAVRPDLLVLDEPLAALDARTRLHVRGELRRQLTGFDGATVVVSHDPVDAIVLADRLVVIEDGRLVQTGAPAEVTRRPRTDYVARLVGLNLAAGVARGHDVELDAGGAIVAGGSLDGPCLVAFRPAAVSVFTERPTGSPRNVWSGTIRGLEPHGDGVRVDLAGVWGRAGSESGGSVVAEITQAALAELDLRVGEPVWAGVKASEVDVYPV
jgi:molybdate transport system ATP-binding protein